MRSTRLAAAICGRPERSAQRRGTIGSGLGQALRLLAIAGTIAGCTPAHSARDTGVIPVDDASSPTDAHAIGDDAAPATLATCARGCTTPTDCAISAGAYDADNYRCDAGACV